MMRRYIRTDIVLNFRTNTGGGVWAFGLVRSGRAKTVKVVSEALRRSGQGQGGVGNADLGGGCSQL